MRLRLLILALLVSGLLPASVAHAEGRVSVANESGGARIDSTYATTLTVRGSGFQSIAGGHGGVYVFFGTVRPGWRPSQGGRTGVDLFYVPDSESRDNQGFQRYVAFPGSDTASSANGGTMSASGSWTTSIVVPGATFQAYDRDGGSRTVDCRKLTCGVITVGAHGVSNSSNESFTPVTVGDLYDGEQPSVPAGPSQTPDSSESREPAGTDASAVPTGTPVPPGSAAPAGPQGPVALDVDRTSARAGHVLAFAATGLPPGSQVSAVLDDGVAAAGPFVVGAGGQAAGVITIPLETGAGTHELRLFGIEAAPSVRFAVQAGDMTVTPTLAEAQARPDSGDRSGVLFLAGSALVLLLVIGRLAFLRRGARHAT